MAHVLMQRMFMGPTGVVHIGLGLNNLPDLLLGLLFFTWLSDETVRVGISSQDEKGIPACDSIACASLILGPLCGCVSRGAGGLGGREERGREPK